MAATTKIKAKIVRDFRDAGTETNYTAGQQVELDEGTFANFRAGGLVEKDDSASTSSGSKSKPTA